MQWTLSKLRASTGPNFAATQTFGEHIKVLPAHLSSYSCLNAWRGKCPDF